MPAKIDLLGRRFGLWRVLSEAPPKPGSTLRRYKVACDCGTRKTVAANELTRGKQPSTNCGCLRADGVREACTTHGLRHHIGYSRYHNMMARCYEPSHPEYTNYGARGITVFVAWRNQTLGLGRYCDYIDSLPGYEPGMEIDRINNNKGYKPGNLRWATRKNNVNNRRKTFMVRHKDKTMPLTELCASQGITDYGMISRIRERIKLGWSVRRALNV